MWNNLFKITLASYIWKRYRRTLIATPLLLLYFWVVNVIHHDIIAYATLNNDTSWLAWSFLAKWLVILLGVVVFLYFTTKSPAEEKPKASLKEKMASTDSSIEELKSGGEGEDVFERIRKKDKLRSKADMVIEKHK